MKKNNLGLPLEYNEAAEYFDLHNTDETTDAKNEYIATILKNYECKTILDMTCGTGSQVFCLHQKGFAVVGSDFSPALVAQAREKARLKNVNISFIEGDMRTVKIGSFDAVITIFNAIGHLTKKEFSAALKNIHSQLCEKGLYVFDIFNLNALTDTVVRDFTMHRFERKDSLQVHTVQYSTIQRHTGRLTSYDTWVVQENSGKPRVVKSHFSLQLYTAQELKRILALNGFEVLAHSDFSGVPLSDAETISMVTIARKK